jgi:hypothetical protein
VRGPGAAPAAAVTCLLALRPGSAETLGMTVSRLLVVVVAFACAACGAAKLQTVSLTNQTSRAIEAIYVYKTGAADHGAPRGGLAPGASTEVKVAPGNVDVLARSAKVIIDEHTRDQPTASQSLEVTGPLHVIFYDAGGTPPPGLDRPGVIGVAFILPTARPAPPADPTPAPAP